ncbi:MAG: hypothetical protein Q4C95_02215 [Planctomycetia bacterium]|nr:hypothetical protein [Planctomycetia bacterium]
MSNNTHNATYRLNNFMITLSDAVVKTTRKPFRLRLQEKELLRISPARLNHEKIKELLKCLNSKDLRQEN